MAVRDCIEVHLAVRSGKSNEGNRRNRVSIPNEITRLRDAIVTHVVAEVIEIVKHSIVFGVIVLVEGKQQNVVHGDEQEGFTYKQVVVDVPFIAVVDLFGKRDGRI